MRALTGPMTSPVGRFAAFVARLGTAAGLIAAVNWAFDYPFTGWVIWQFGSLAGSVVVLVLAPIFNYLIVLWYRRTTPDWFGLEWLRTQEAMDSQDWSGRVIRSFLRRSRLLAFVAIAALADPVYAFIYQRGRISGVRFNASDWWWFGLANIIGILPWVIGASIVVETAKRAIN